MRAVAWTDSVQGGLMVVALAAVCARIVWEQDGVKIATDEMSQQYIGGTEVDYVSGLQGAGFKFNNPNAKSSCGCGSSFSA